MERGVVVGGLMICGSFLLAVSLNRSAVNETQRAEPPTAEAPISPPLPKVHVDGPQPATCASSASSTDQTVAGNAPEGDLPGNGREACSQ
jgi:hypothetical protein